MKRNMMYAIAALIVVGGAAALDTVIFGGTMGIGMAVAVVNLIPTPNIRLSEFSYPSDAKVLQVQGDGNIFHQIWVSTDVSALLTATDGTGFGNAPVGTVIHQYLAGAVKTYVKETDATWMTFTAA